MPLAVHIASTTPIMLGDFGGELTLIQAEDMSWRLNPETPPNESDTVRHGANAYTLKLAGDVWAATFVPKSMEVTLGLSGESVTVTQAEAGGCVYDDMLLSDAAYRTSTNGATYLLAIGGEGTPSQHTCPGLSPSVSGTGAARSGCSCGRARRPGCWKARPTPSRAGA